MLNLCVLIPSFNESATIGGLVRSLVSSGFAVCVVDDGSKDNTSDIARNSGATVVRYTTNAGKGAALRTGFKIVMEKNYDAVIVMDADGQHEVADIEHFIRKMDETGAHMVIGNRMGDVSNMPPIRVYTNRFMSFLISRISGQRVPDTQCGFRLIRTEVLKKVKLESSKYEIESEMIIRAARAGFKLASVNIKTVYAGEKSGINPVVDTFRFMALMAKVMFNK